MTTKGKRKKSYVAWVEKKVFPDIFQWSYEKREDSALIPHGEGIFRCKSKTGDIPEVKVRITIEEI